MIHESDTRSAQTRLARAAAAGDTRAYEEIYRANLGRVYALCLRMSRNKPQAEELTQDVFVRIWERLSLFRGDSAFSTWLHRVAVNVVIESLRAQGRWRERFVSERDHEPDAFSKPQPEAGTNVDLERAIAALPSRARLVFVLHDIEGYKHQEIADIAGIAVGTCKAHLHRARQQLKEQLKDEPRQDSKQELRG